MVYRWLDLMRGSGLFQPGTGPVINQHPYSPLERWFLEIWMVNFKDQADRRNQLQLAAAVRQCFVLGFDCCFHLLARHPPL